MNYISLLNAFEQWCETNCLPSMSQLIWYKLIALFNRCAWSEWVTVDNQRLMVLTGIRNEKTFILYRDKLLDANLFFYEKGKKGSPNRYKINTVNFTVDCTVFPTVKTTVNPTVFPTVEPTDINKLNKTKYYYLILDKYKSQIPTDLNFQNQIHFQNQVMNDELYNLLTREEQIEIINEFWNGWRKK